MSENVITPGAGSSGAASTGNNGNVTDKGGSTAVAEPRVGWAGDDQRVNTDAGHDDTRDDDVSLDTADADAEFGDESFDDDADAGEKKDVPFKELLEQLKSQDPAVLKAAEKQIKRDFFENRRYKQIPGMESPEKARELVDKLETFGGVEGIEQSRTENVATWEMLANGDPALLDKLEKTHAEGISKLAPHVLDRFEKLDPQGWAHSMAAVFMNTMNAAPAGGISALAALNGLLKQFPDVAKSAEFQRVAEVVNGVADIAAKAPQKAAGGDDKFKQREQKIAEKENVIYQREVSAKVAPMLKKVATDALTAQLKGRKVSNDARAELMKDVNLEYAQLAKKDTDFQKNAKALLDAGETDKFVKLCKANMERTMPMAAKRVWRKYAGIAGLNDADKSQRRAEGNSRTEAGGGGATSGTIKTGTPKPADVDWARMRAEFGRDKADDMFLFQRKYYKKGDAKNVYSH